MNQLTESDIHQLQQHIVNDGVIAYPTEAVFGLGCHPKSETAVNTILQLKKRSVDKGLILIASNYSQLVEFVDDKAIPFERRPDIFSSWPGPVTWLLPKSVNAPYWITGESDFIAVRVTAHPIVCQMCNELGMPLVSTSANPATLAPALNAFEVKTYFGQKVHIIDRSVGTSGTPSQIKHSMTGDIVRP